MGREWTIRSFKSGNSTALRVPAAVGIEPGKEWRLVEVVDGYRLEQLPRPKRKFNVAKVAGSARALEFIKPEDRVFEERPKPWDAPDRPGWNSRSR